MAEENNYMSGRYGGDSDGGIAFSEKKLETSRKRIEKRQKYFDRFQKIYPFVNAGVKIGNALVQDRAQARQNELNFQFANHKIVHDNGSNVRAQHELNLKNGVSDEDYLRDMYYERATNELIEYFGEDLDINSFTGAIYNFAQEQAEATLPSYQNMVKASYELPEWADDGVEHQAWFNKNQGGNPPQNLMQLVGFRIRDFVRGNDKETLEAQEQLTPIQLQFAKYGEFQKTAELYHNITRNGKALLDVLSNEEKDTAKGKIIGQPQIVVMDPVYDEPNNVFTTVTKLVVAREGLQGKDPTYKAQVISTDVTPAKSDVVPINHIIELQAKVQPGSESFKRINELIAEGGTGPNKQFKYSEYINIINQISPNDRVKDFDDIEDLMQIKLGNDRIEDEKGNLIDLGEWDVLSKRWRINPVVLQSPYLMEKSGLDKLKVSIDDYLQWYTKVEFDVPISNQEEEDDDVRDDVQVVGLPINAIMPGEYFSEFGDEEKNNLDAMFKEALGKPVSAEGFGLTEMIMEDPNRETYKISNINFALHFNNKSLPDDYFDIYVTPDGSIPTYFVKAGEQLILE